MARQAPTLNLSPYDLIDLRRLANEMGFDILQNGARPFALWDALAFVLRRWRSKAADPNVGL